MSDLPARPSARELVRRYEPSETIWAVLRTSTQRGPWEPPDATRVVSVLGQVVLDYRDAELPLGDTIVDCEVFLGNVEIVVPPDVDVEITGSIVLGHVETKDARGSGLGRWVRDRLLPGSRGPDPDDGLEDDDERPLLRVDCSGLLGSVEIRLG